MGQVCALPKLPPGPSSMGHQFYTMCVSQPLGYSICTPLITFSKAKLNKAVRISIYLTDSHGHSDFYNHKKKQQVMYTMCTCHIFFFVIHKFVMFEKKIETYNSLAVSDKNVEFTAQTCWDAVQWEVSIYLFMSSMLNVGQPLNMSKNGLPQIIHHSCFPTTSASFSLNYPYCYHLLYAIMP